MQLSTRAAMLRTAIERAVRTVATVTESGATLRITAVVGEDRTVAEFRLALRAVQAGDDWGSSAVDGAVKIWTEVTEGHP